MSSSSSTTLRITGTRKAIAEAIALNVSNQCNRIVKVSEIFNFVLDKHLNMETADLITQEFKKKEGVK
ncbi:hypothetical protein H3S74_12245 [Gilliamella sp. W8126]|uniref:hypothetical protein n=1 Tax=Gilliamella sp. W8126 TaxID=2750946 RepID=UPI0018DDD06D|nr:hypothetical protein [Gilliamella sp. W8126]MBI0007000.1 hypothetical protein [Gilliamella sp. W8126]